MDVSSPGPPSGHFYNMCTGGNWKQYHVTAFDCPHLSEEYISEIKDSYGETSALYKSMIMAEFGGMDEQVVINHQKLVDLDKHEIEHLEEEYNIAGLDLSAGGDEQVLVIRNGNKTLAVEAFNFRDTVALINHLEHLFRKYKLDHEQSVIYGDAGGLGKPILDQLKANWNIVYVLNQAKPYNNLAYLNRGAELWFSVGKLIEYGEIMVPRESKLRKQLASRYFEVTPQNKLQLESKKQARSKGHVSPDRADAFVLAFADYRGIKPKKLRRKRTEKFTPKQFNLTSNRQRAVFGFQVKPNPWLQDEIQQLQELSRSRN